MNKYKKLAFNTLIFAIGSFGSKLLVFLLNRLYTNQFSPEEYGTKGLLVTSALFLQPIFTFALQEYLIRFGLDKNYDKRTVFTTSAVITGAGMLAMLLIVPGLRYIPLLSFLNGYSLLLIIYVAMSSLRMLCQQFVRARDMVKLFSLDGIISTLLLFIFNLVFIAGLKMGIKGFMLAVVMSDACSSVFLILMGGLQNFFRPGSFSIKAARDMMKFAVPLIPTIVMWTVTSLSDRFFINSMSSTRVTLGTGAAGLYDNANIAPNIISMVSTIFFQAWNMSAITENDSADRSRFYEKVYGVYESVLFVASAGLLLLIKPVTLLLVDTKNFPEYITAYSYAPILVIAVLFTALNQFLGGIYNATKHSKNSFWTCFAACVVNLILNYFLIPCWGIHGAAIATLFSYLFCYWLRMVDARYYVPFRFDPLRNLANTVILIAMSGIIIASPKLWGVWLIPLFIAVVMLNYGAMIEMVKKVLKINN